MEPLVPYIACLAGAMAIYLMLRPGRKGVRGAGALLGLGVFAWLLVEIGRAFAMPAGSTVLKQEPMFYVFSIIAVAAAMRMITHHRPVYSALYFVMVVLSSAALFLLLSAEFMAFALVIVYAGAILITYMFVLMLAQQAGSAALGSASPSSESGASAQPEYDRIPREPAAASLVGFIMLALMSHMVFAGTLTLPHPPSSEDVLARQWRALEMMPRELNRAVQAIEPGVVVPPDARVQVVAGEGYLEVQRPEGFTPPRVMHQLPASALPSNVQLVGLDLVWKFPVSLELAGVILLMAMFGAVVLARKQIELGEDEVREAAGMRRLSLHDEPVKPSDGAGSSGLHRGGGA